VPFTESLAVDGKELLEEPCGEISFHVYKATPNSEPKGLKGGEGGTIDLVGKQLTTDVLDVQDLGAEAGSQTRWVDDVGVDAQSWPQLLGTAKFSTVHHANGEEVALTTQRGPLGLALKIHYMAFKDQPSIRKWVEVQTRDLPG
jgi:hypothetical protein